MRQPVQHQSARLHHVVRPLFEFYTAKKNKRIAAQAIELTEEQRLRRTFARFDLLRCRLAHHILFRIFALLIRTVLIEDIDQAPEQLGGGQRCAARIATPSACIQNLGVGLAHPRYQLRDSSNEISTGAIQRRQQSIRIRQTTDLGQNERSGLVSSNRARDSVAREFMLVESGCTSELRCKLTFAPTSNDPRLSRILQSHRLIRCLLHGRLVSLCSC
jgi:hypothetical protein